MKLPDITFQFTSGPSFVLTFLGIIAYAFKSKADFSGVAEALIFLYGLHAGKRLWQKLKDPRIGVEKESGTGSPEGEAK